MWEKTRNHDHSGPNRLHHIESAFVLLEVIVSSSKLQNGSSFKKQIYQSQTAGFSSEIGIFEEPSAFNYICQMPFGSIKVN